MSPIDNLERIRNDFEYDGCGSGELAVSLDPDRVIAVDHRNPGATELDLSQGAVRPAVQARQAEYALDAPDVSDRYHLEASVVDLRTWCDEHRAAQVGAIRDRDRSNPARERGTVVEAKTNQGVAMNEQAHHRGPEKIECSPCPRRTVGGAPHDLGADPDVGHVDKEFASR